MRDNHPARRAAAAARDWDLICVGSGITALAFAAQLARRHPGARVLLLEKHYVPGGYASNFRRRRLRFDCSLHKLTGMYEGGNLRRMFAELGLSDVLRLIYPSTYFEAVGAGPPLKLSNRYEEFKEQLLSRFPQEHAGLLRYFEEVEIHGKNSYHLFQIMAGTMRPDLTQLRYAHRHLRRVLVSDALAERFSDPVLREVLAAPGIYAGGFPEDLSYLYYLHVVYATLCLGSAYVEGGSQQISDALVEQIRAAGGEVLLRTEVSRILVDGELRAYGVETERGEFRAEQIYVNAAPRYAMRALLPDLPCLQGARTQLDALHASYSTTTVYATTDAPPEELGLLSSESMVLPREPESAIALRRAARESGWGAAECERAYWQGSTMEVTNYHRLDPSGGAVICLNALDRIDHWPARDSAEYGPKKARAGAVLLERLFQQHPALRGRIVYQEVSTPHTYERYTNNSAGAGYGAMVGTDTSGHTFHYQFPVKGLHFLSAWVAGPSYEAAFGYAEMKAQTYSKEGRA